MSRDAKRIPEVLAVLGELWMENPDMRLGQMMGNASITYYTEDDKAAVALTQWRDYCRDRKAGITP
jgi:uncharacterized protein YihD (DUF1040 family)